MRLLLILILFILPPPLYAGERAVRFNTDFTFYVNLNVEWLGKTHTARSCRVLMGDFDTDPDPLEFKLDMRCPKGVFKLRGCTLQGRDVFEIEVRQGVGDPNLVTCQHIRKR